MALVRRSFVLLAVCSFTVLPVAGPPSRAQDQPKPEATRQAFPRIFRFVSSGNVAGVKAALVADPAQANVVGPSEVTPLGLALKMKNLEVVQALLDGGAEPNKPFGPEHSVPLQGAVASGNLDAVKALLAKGADPNGKDVNGGTALHLAVLNVAGAFYGGIELVELLVAKGADVNAAFTAGPNAGATPLHYAAQTKELRMVRAVDAHQPNWNLKWKNLTPAEVADGNEAPAVAAYIRTRQGGGGAAEANAASQAVLEKASSDADANLALAKARLAKAEAAQGHGSAPTAESKPATASAEQQAKPDEKSVATPPIFGFVSSGNVAGVKTVLAANPKQANAVGPGEMTPLGIALAKESLEVVQALLDGGADPNKPFGPEQRVPLERAVNFGTPDAVKALLAKGADPNGKDVNGATALHLAAMDGLIEIAKLLVEKGADVNAPVTAGPGVGVTPLHYAARSKSLPLVMALAPHQPDWNLKWKGFTPAEVADANKATDVAEYIRGQMEKGGSAPVRAQQEAKPDEGSSARPPIFEFVYKEDAAGVRAAMAADPTQANVVWKGVTPLGSAVGRKSLEVVQALLDGGADPNKPFGEEQWVPLRRAVTFGTSDAVIALLAKGADPNGKDINGGTALHAAAKDGLIEIAKLLLDKGADVNAPFTAGGNLGATPLHFAVRSNSLPLVMALAAHQPNWNLKWRDLTPVDVADLNKLTDMAAYIRSQQATGGSQPLRAQQKVEAGSEANLSPAIFRLVESGDVAGVKAALIADPAQANLEGPEKMTPLSLAMGDKSIEMLKALLQGGADPNKPIDAIHTPPLQLAVVKGNPDAVTALLAGGANPNGKNDDGFAALHVAVGNGLTAISKLLVDKGADVDATTPELMTPLAVALASKNLEMVQALLQLGADPNKPAGTSHTPPIETAVLFGAPDTIKALLAKGADPNAKADGGAAALHAVVKTGSIEIANLLLDKGADVNAPMTGDGAGLTPLFMAVASKNLAMVMAFAAHQPNWNLKWSGGTPFEVADRAGSTDIADYIRAEQAKKK